MQSLCDYILNINKKDEVKKKVEENNYVERKGESEESNILDEEEE